MSGTGAGSGSGGGATTGAGGGGGGGAACFTTAFFGAAFLGAAFFGAAFFGAAFFGAAFFGAAFFTAFFGAAFAAAFFGAVFLAAFFGAAFFTIFFAACFAGFFLVAILIYLEYVCSAVRVNSSYLNHGAKAHLFCEKRSPHGSCERRLRRQPQLLQERRCLRALGRGQARDSALHGGFVIRKGGVDQLPPGCGEMHYARAAVGGIETTLHQAFLLQTIDGGGDGAAGETDLDPDGVDGSGPAVEEQLQNTEIRETQSERFNVTARMLPEGVMSLPQDQPEPDAGGLHQGFLTAMIPSITLKPR